MKPLKNISFILLLLVIMSSFLHCSSTKKLQSEIPFEIGDVYYQDWVTGEKGGGSGVNLFIPIILNPNNIILDSIYFRGEQSKLEMTNKTLYVGRFQDDSNEKEDIIMSNEPFAEYGNKVPEFPKKIPFKLKANACVISYKQGIKIKYFKIEGLTKK
ncbi:hypothetical protein L3X37_00290 [Sabulilitoribacter arenilitoris]|uniref:Uncharacterized protein n=1 Tax=Wocania arenilitoris TaxID=2044858 RepID=A0AAE3EN02_9FLAO|nr:hypothetical protein [Wocania arenilitoris]MCF7566805.1 hypothetical protein [Wocania arenilitoris]